jgi:hypothetical protein
MGPMPLGAARPAGTASVVRCCSLWTVMLGPTDMEPGVTVFADLVLEGGGVKGIALVGAISVLEERGYDFRRVAGTRPGRSSGRWWPPAPGLPSSRRSCAGLTTGGSRTGHGGGALMAIPIASGRDAFMALPISACSRPAGPAYCCRPLPGGSRTSVSAVPRISGNNDSSTASCWPGRPLR